MSRPVGEVSGGGARCTKPMQTVPGSDKGGVCYLAEAAQAEMSTLVLFKGDMASFVRIYTFLSQIFDYGNTDLEKRAIFYRRLIPLLEFGREREGIDLS